MINHVFIASLCILSIVIPVIMYRKLESKFHHSINIGTYILLAISTYFVLSSNSRNWYYWLAFASILFGYIVNYVLTYSSLCHPDNPYNRRLANMYCIILSIQMLACYAIEPLAGILISPVFTWYLLKA